MGQRAAEVRCGQLDDVRIGFERTNENHAAEQRRREVVGVGASACDHLAGESVAEQCGARKLKTEQLVDGDDRSDRTGGARTETALERHSFVDLEIDGDLWRFALE